MFAQHSALEPKNATLDQDIQSHQQRHLDVYELEWCLECGPEDSLYLSNRKLLFKVPMEKLRCLKKLFRRSSQNSYGISGAEMGIAIDFDTKNR
jgi:hypothetical protein